MGATSVVGMGSMDGWDGYLISIEHWVGRESKAQTKGIH